MPFLIKTREIKEFSDKDDYNLFFVDILLSIPKKRLFVRQEIRYRMVQNIVLSKKVEEAQLFPTLVEAQKTKSQLREINDDYSYLIVEVEVKKE